LEGYVIPIAGYPFGQFMMDTHALRCDMGFQFTEGPVWLTDMATGCAARPPIGDSEGYGRRLLETRLAERAIEIAADAMRTLRHSVS
jgi:hypothetical protein